MCGKGRKFEEILKEELLIIFSCSLDVNIYISHLNFWTYISLKMLTENRF